jgi:hypothetical protein
VENNLTLSLSQFWDWVVTHPNCILRAGTPETVLYDDEDLHWHFAAEGPEMLVVQLLRGKRLLGEMLVAPEHISFVNGVQGEQDGEFVFELVQEADNDRFAAYFFVLAHGYDHESPATPSRVH